MATFWQHLNWPVASEAYGYAVSLVENMCSCASLFIEEVFAGLQPKDFVDDQGRFKASEKVGQSSILYISQICLYTVKLG